MTRPSIGLLFWFVFFFSLCQKQESVEAPPCVLHPSSYLLYTTHTQTPRGNLKYPFDLNMPGFWTVGENLQTHFDSDL